MPPRRHVAVEPRCFLCDNALPEAKGAAHQPKFVAIFAVRRNSSDIYTDISSSADILAFAENNCDRIHFEVPGARHTFLRYHSETSGNTSGEYCGYCLRVQMPFFSHLECWKVAKKHGNEAARLYRFAYQTQPLAPWRGDRPHVRIWDIPSLARLVNKETSLGRLIADISRLPPELQSKIMLDLEKDSTDVYVHNRYDGIFEKASVPKCRADMFTRLAAVELEAVPLLRHIDPVEHPVPRTCIPTTRGSDSVSVSTLYINTRNIFGRDYISGIGYNRSGGDLISIPVLSQNIDGLRFALGRFGLRAIRILYSDGSCSPWLGDPSGSWFGHAEGSSFRNLSYVEDGLCVVQLRMTKSIWQTRSGVRRVLTDQEFDAPPGKPLAFTCRPSDLWPRLSLRIYRRWRFFCHLPLQFGSSYSTGLTMYWSGRLLTGMASYGPAGQMASIGQRTQEAMHFPLAPGEYFTSLWIRAGNRSNLITQPFLVTLSTNKDRTCHFGPHRLVRYAFDLITLPSAWEKVSFWDSPTKITGILVDAFNERAAEGYCNLGLVEEPVKLSNDPAMWPPPTMEDFDRNNDERPLLQRLTTGSTCDVTSLQLRRVGRRCLGLRIVHSSGLDDFLGSWDPHDTTSVSTLYSSTEGPLTALTFHMALGQNGRHYVSDIIACTDSTALHPPQTPPTPTDTGSPQRSNPLQDNRAWQFTCGNGEKRLAWWFDGESDELREYDWQPPVGILTRVRPAAAYALIWQPPKKLKDLLWWIEGGSDLESEVN